jgi:hypothetical protein
LQQDSDNQAIVIADQEQDSRNTALILAIKKDYTNLALAIIARGANVHLASANGLTALHWASVTRNDTVIAALLGAGADSLCRTPEGITARDYYTHDYVHCDRIFAFVWYPEYGLVEKTIVLAPEYETVDHHHQPDFFSKRPHINPSIACMLGDSTASALTERILQGIDTRLKSMQDIVDDLFDMQPSLLLPEIFRHYNRELLSSFVNALAREASQQSNGHS